MSTRRLILGIPTVLVLSAVVSAGDVSPVDATPCVQGYPTPLTAGGQAGFTGHAGDCDCEACGGGSWWSRTTLGIRRHWFRHWQKQKHLQHPEAPPFFQENWGYHPTCWRRFPPICNPCPPVEPGGNAPNGQGQPIPAGTLPPAPGPPQSSTGSQPRNVGAWSRVRSE